MSTEEEQRIVIFGTSVYSHYLYYTIKAERRYNIVAFSLTKYIISDSTDTFCNLPIYPLENLKDCIDGQFKVLICVGYKNMNKGRECIYKMCKELNYEIFTYISTRAICDTEIGEGCIVMPTAYIPADTHVGICNVFNPSSNISHTGALGNFNWIASDVSMAGNVTMGDFCFVGVSSVINNSIKIGSEVFIGANSHLTEDAIDGMAYIGSPAKTKKGYKSQLLVKLAL